MADQVMTVVNAVKAGILDVAGNAAAKVGTAAGGDQFLFPNDGQTVLAVVGGAAPSAITFTAVVNQYGRTETLVMTPGTNKTSIIGPFKPHLFNNSSGQVEFDPAGGGQADDYYLAIRVSR